ncbi:hypothetical protein N7517_005946 [Penicillium concentricum]|uniref:Uncharacterized protein n=1 Tax=Penicillium concentricum TaxID=293559 RepID=A0A9W9S8T3_9EURO|nr:uncharacterized protein N7517_005946 [Penicillium concentricum]KAJ5373940.1 hypothetical protein N7517_005946 [Penicillium concentricum]
MSSASQRALTALCDSMASVSISATGENQLAQSPSSTALATNLSSLSPSTDGMDPFRRLPWFAIEEILLRLKDLPTLHRLYQASPAVADYLNHTPGFFPKLVETLMILKQYGRDMGPHTDTKVFFRTLVYLWWKEQSMATGELISSADNPLPATFQDHLIYHVNTSTLYGWCERYWIGEISLPPSTPPQALRRLLSLTSRIRRDSHAFFHGCLHLCVNSNLKRLAYHKSRWPENGTRPRGTPIDNSWAGTHELSWLEEQRLFHAFLKVYIFSELRRLVFKEGVLKFDPNRIISGEWLPHTSTHLKEGNLIEFWIDFTGQTGDPENMEQLKSVVSWLKEGRPMHGKPLEGRWQFEKCCPDLCIFEQSRYERVTGADPLYGGLNTGCFWAQNCEFVPQSGVKEAALEGKFRKFGFAFWHDDRMIGLGILLPRFLNETVCTDIAYRWTSLLQPKDEVPRNRKPQHQRWTLTHRSRQTNSNSRR